MLISLKRTLALLVLTLVPFLAMAAQTPQQVVQQTVDTLLSDLQQNKANYKTNPAEFHRALNRILGPALDVNNISRGVMTVKYSRSASPAQMQRFETIFKDSLIRFYGNALLEYDNQEIRVLPSQAKATDQRASINMEVVGTNGAVYPVSYTMVNQSGQWKVRNVIINGINVGKLFRDQFAESMQRNNNDLDKTIDGWGEVVANAKSAATEGEAR